MTNDDDDDPHSDAAAHKLDMKGGKVQLELASLQCAVPTSAVTFHFSLLL